MRIALIVSHYNRRDLLDLCLHSVSLQTRKPDEVIVIDDGSKVPFGQSVPLHLRDMRSMVYRRDMSGPNTACIQMEAVNVPEIIDLYIRQEHNDFGKWRLANKAILETNCDYLVFLDQDCIIPPDFIEIHERIAKRDQYVCAVYSNLQPWDTPFVTRESISNGTLWRNLNNRYEGTPNVWFGSGSAVWKTDALRINGFDTRAAWCGGDTNFSLRLAQVVPNWDHFCKYGRYFHIWHERPWGKTSEERGRSLKEARAWAAESPVTPHGIAQQNMNAFEVIRKPKEEIYG